MKHSGILLLFLCCAGLGFCASFRLRKQTAVFRKLMLFLEDCMTYIRYQHLTLPELFAVLNQNSVYAGWDFIRNLNQNPGLAPELRWNFALQESQLPAQAREILRQLGTELGKSDTSGQLAVLTLCREQMRTALEQHQAECAGKSRLCQSLGCLGGAMLAVLFW